jgi:hypothetical protein
MTMSMSGRAMTLFQSVAVSCQPQREANSSSDVLSRPTATLSTGSAGRSKNFAAELQAWL